MSENQCKNCKYYLQHFSLNSRKLFWVYCGHCTYSRTRQKKPDAKACENFVFGPPQEDGVVTKEYLSKELLQYVLSLELMPEIEGRGKD